jgi:hypothetical protein
MSARAPVRPFCGIRLADHRPELLGWDEILQAFATAAIGRSLRPVHQTGVTMELPTVDGGSAPLQFPSCRPYGQVLEVALSCGVYRGVIVVGMFFTKDPRLNDTSTDSR